MKKLILTLLIFCLHDCKETKPEVSKATVSQQMDEVKTETEVVPELGELRISAGSITLTSDEILAFDDGMKDISISDFLDFFGLVHPAVIGKDITLVDLNGNEINPVNFYQTMNFSIRKEGDGNFTYNLHYPYSEDEYFDSLGKIRSVKCRNLDRPRNECKIFVKANKLSNSFPNQYFDYSYFHFIVKDKYLFLVQGFDGKGIGQMSFFTFQVKGADFPRTNLEYLKAAIKILNADEKNKHILKDFKPDDLEYFLQ
ncbi:hypothetical protein LPTSP4_35900 [Leptospira ryugenii]|uniref:Uncharacterized protein n=1 Tax=Leptospira ryugenii TaxID=1917863 RepID=A0A2P2E5B6_9LEPT|nr:hypothetical protein [Leptospira ryugenii]GBF52052.1 hypothetical protein LPTSP4_35900 [Leptospira ryugenii]